MVANVSSLLKTVKSVEDKALRGTRALESTVDAVKQAVLVNRLIVKMPLVGGVWLFRSNKERIWKTKRRSSHGCAYQS